MGGAVSSSSTLWSARRSKKRSRKWMIPARNSRPLNEKRQNKQQLKSDISQVREQTDTANNKISQVGNDVTAVKTDLTSTKSELEKTVADLKRATGEIDGHSVMIATNGKELAALRALGERNFVEFTIHKAKPLAPRSSTTFRSC